MCKFTVEVEPEDIWKARGKVDIVEWVRGKEQEKAECQQRYCGWGDREYWEDCWRNTEQQGRSISINTTSSI